MRKYLKILAIAATIAVPLSATSGLFAHEPLGSGGSAPSTGMMGQGGAPGMMGQGGQGGMMGQNGMMGMMGQMTQMMDTCNKSMQSMMQDQGGRAPGGQMPQTMPGTPQPNG